MEDAHPTPSRASLGGTWHLAGRALLAYRVAPLAIQIVIGMILLVTVWAALNWMVQVTRKPSGVLFPVTGSLSKLRPRLGANTGLLRNALHNGDHAGTAGLTGPD